MALTVNTNVSALNARRHTNDSQLDMAVAMERLASGKRINSARDDAAGLAIAGRMEAQISGLNQAVRNSADAISLVQTAEGALQEYGEILQRIRELAIQSGGGAPSNADRVNLNKEVQQLQQELGRIANTTRFNGEILLNGTFLDKDFQIGQSNQEEISVSIEDLRPERVGAYTQNVIGNVGTLRGVTKTNMGSTGDPIDNGVKSQTITVGVGSETPRTVAIAKGDSARTIADKLNQSGAAINSRATTTTDIFIEGGSNSFAFKLSSGATPDLITQINVAAGNPGSHNALAAQVNAEFSNHGISATVETYTDESGTDAFFVRLHQANGYDIIVDDFETAGAVGKDVNLDFGGQNEVVLTGAAGAQKTIIGGTLIVDAPESFILTSDDATSSLLVSSRGYLNFEDIDTDIGNQFAKWDQKVFKLSVNGEVLTITTGDYSNATNFPTFQEVVADINSKVGTAIAANTNLNNGTLGDATDDIKVDFIFSDSTQNLEVVITNGVSTSTSSLALTENGTAVTDLDFLAVNLTDDSLVTTISHIGGDANPTESVRYVSQIDIGTRAGALLTMTVVDAALEVVASNRATLGAVANRLESTIQNLMTTSENTAASLSRVMDADYAAESSALARAQVLQQASIAILAQANATAQQVLRLLE